MSRRLVNLTLDTLEDLPRPCRQCVFWELDPVSAQRACAAGDPGLEKEAWVSQTLLEWGSCGKLIYVDTSPAGFALYAPPAYVPRSMAFPTSPVSADAVLLMTAHVVVAVRRRRARPDADPGRRPRSDEARHQGDRGVRRREVRRHQAGGRRRGQVPDDMVPLISARRRAAWRRPTSSCRSASRRCARTRAIPRLRLDLRTALSWKSDVEYALEKLLGSMSPESILRPVGRPPVDHGRTTGDLASAG